MLAKLAIFNTGKLVENRQHRVALLDGMVEFETELRRELHAHLPVDRLLELVRVVNQVGEGAFLP